MDFQLEGHVAIVTGAGRGLGLAAAEALVSEGANVVAAARSRDELDALADRLPGRVLPVVADMTDRAKVASLPELAREHFGRLDVVVNNAGIAPATPFIEQDFRVWDEVLAVNVTATAILCQEAARLLLDQGRGSIINVVSGTALRGKARLAAYSASKGAVIRLTEALAAEWTRHGVRVNAVAPGAFSTKAQQEVLEDPELLRKRIAKISARRMGDPDEIGPLVAYLASPVSSFVSGSTFIIDGGEVNKL